MSDRAGDLAAVSAVALVITLVIAAPVLRAPSERLFGRETVGRHYDPFSAMERFGTPPASGVYTQPLTDVAGATLARASGPVAAYNWLVLLTFPLSAVAAFLLARHLRLSRAAAALSAIAFAFSPFHLAQAAYHPHIAQTQWMPLYLLALWRCMDRATIAAVGLLGLSIAAVTLSNFYGGFIAAVITPVAVGTYWFFESRRHPQSARSLVITLGCLVIAALVGLGAVWYQAHDVVVNREAFAFPRADLFRYSAKWWSYLLPPVANTFVGRSVQRAWSAAGIREGLLEQQVSLGWGVVALGVVAIGAWMIRGRTLTSLAIVPVLALVACFALLCSLSPERVIGPVTFTRPSAVLYQVLPMFRSYGRFGVIVQLMAALLAGIGLERLWASGSRRARVACAACLALVFAEYAVSPSAMSRDVLPTAAHRWMVRQPGNVRALDCASSTLESASVEWLSGHRISLRAAGSDDCTQPNLADNLSAAGYTHVIVRRQTLEGRWFAARQTPRGLVDAAEFFDGRVFTIAARVPSVYTARMTAFYPREHDETWAWRWMGPQASWTIVNRTARPIVALVDVEMTAFHRARRLKVLLDGTEVQALTVAERRGPNRLGPLDLTPGIHELLFQPIDPPSVANDLTANGDRRPLSFGIGAWQWQVEGERR
jgi:hypothetical protein